MAIDTQQSRMSATGAGRPFLRAVYPTHPKTVEWRISVGNAYSGCGCAAVITGKILFAYTLPSIENYTLPAIADYVLPDLPSFTL